MSKKEKGYLAQITPILPVADVLEALEFYVQKLDFEILFFDEEKAPRYAGIRRDNIIIHLQRYKAEDPKTLHGPVVLRIQVQAVRALYEEYKLKGVFHNHTALEETPWNTLEFAFNDPFKNGLIFYHYK